MEFVGEQAIQIQQHWMGRVTKQQSLCCTTTTLTTQKEKLFFSTELEWTGSSENSFLKRKPRLLSSTSFTYIIHSVCLLLLSCFRRRIKSIVHRTVNIQKNRIHLKLFIRDFLLMLVMMTIHTGRVHVISGENTHQTPSRCTWIPATQ